MTIANKKNLRERFEKDLEEERTTIELILREELEKEQTPSDQPIGDREHFYKVGPEQLFYKVKFQQFKYGRVEIQDIDVVDRSKIDTFPPSSPSIVKEIPGLMGYVVENKPNKSVAYVNINQTRHHISIKQFNRSIGWNNLPAGVICQRK